MHAPEPVSNKDICAAFTGDLIGSRQVSGNLVTAAFGALRTAVARFEDENDLDLRFTRFRGDGWQLILDEPMLTLDLSVFLIASLRAEDCRLATRIAIGFGEISHRGTQDLSDAAGDAFETAGHHLDAMRRKRRLVVAGAGIGMKEIAIFDLLEFMCNGWTAIQARTVAEMILNDSTHQDIADRFGITRQAVQSTLASAGYHYLENARRAFRKAD